MNAKELKELRSEIKFDMRSMALCCGVALSTYQRYEDGSAAVPDHIKRASLELKQINKQFNIESLARIDAEVLKQKPFISAGNDFND